MAFGKNIITIVDIQKFKPLSKNTDTEKKVDPFIQEAQEFELIEFMGDPFYLELLDQFFTLPVPFPNVKYKELFEGSIWLKNGKRQKNPGIISMLSLYSYSRYLNRANTNSTAFGMVKKLDPNSEVITEKTLQRLVAQANSAAKAYENKVKYFLDCNSSDFPLYECSVNNKKTGSVRISGAGGNSQGGRVYNPVSKRYI